MREHGASAVTVDAVLAVTGTPRGSVYHHFPGGRDELVMSAARAAADFITAALDQAASAAGPEAGIAAFGEAWEGMLAAGDYRAGCPIAALTVDARDDLPVAAELARETFAAWQQRIGEILVEAGVGPQRAESLATMTISSFEGAILLCRVRRGPDPLRQVVGHLRDLVVAELERPSGSR
jgi:TetR/AcrR family transcriptional repressor of lmrAB and yxaGH operons